MASLAVLLGLGQASAAMAQTAGASAPAMLAGLPPWAFSAGLLGLAALAIAGLLAWIPYRNRRGRTAASAGIRKDASRTRRRLARIELAAERIASSPLSGTFRSAFIGMDGSDFAEFAPYRSGEDTRPIDWPKSAEAEEVLIRRSVAEREMKLLLVADLSGSSDGEKREAIEEAAGALALAAARQGLRVGLLAATDRRELEVPPRSGPGHAEGLLRSLIELEPRGRGTDLGAALERVRTMLRDRAIVVLVSDLLDPGASFGPELAETARRHDLRVIRILAQDDVRTPPETGLTYRRDAETGREVLADTSSRRWREEHASAVAAREARLAARLSKAGIRPLVLPVEEDPLKALVAHFQNGRKRR